MGRTRDDDFLRCDSQSIHACTSTVVEVNYNVKNFSRRNC